MSSSATILNNSQNGNYVQKLSSSTSGVPRNTMTTQENVAPSNATTTQGSRSHQGNRKRPRGSTILARADGQPSSNEASANPPRSRRTTPRRFVEDDITADGAISDSSIVHGTSNVPFPPTGRLQGSRSRNTSWSRTYKGPGSSSARAAEEPGISSETADREDTGVTVGDLKSAEKNISGGNYPSLYARAAQNTTTQASGRHQGNRKRSRGSTSLARLDGQTSSSEANANPTRSKRTTSRRVIEDDLTPTERALSDTPVVRCTSDVPLPRTGRGQGSRSRSRSRNGIFRTRLLGNLRNHPSVYARAGRNPPTQGLTFRGAWKRAVELYLAANDQYKQLFSAAGFGDFLKIKPVKLPQGYLIALTERWFTKTNTLHLPCCELGPTPVDWTMITGLRFGGRRIKLDPNYEMKKVPELLGLEGREDIFKGRNILLSAIKPFKSEVTAVPPTREAKERIFRRLFLYVIGSSLFGNNQSWIQPGFLMFLEDIDAVGTYNWGAITYAAFLTGLRRKVSKEIGSFTAFWQFLLFWAFEYLNISRPELADENAFPRAMRWKFPINLSTLDNSELTACRCQLDFVDDESQITWEPYLHRLGGVVYSVALAERRVRFMGLDSWEYYLGERCRRQLGLPYLVPSDPPKNMNGESKSNRKDRINIGRSAETFVRTDIVDHGNWFANNSIGRIVDVTRLIGGPDIGRKVIGHWMAKHRPGMILVPKSEVKETKKAIDTAKAEREKLQEELSRLRRSSGS